MFNRTIREQLTEAVILRAAIGVALVLTTLGLGLVSHYYNVIQVSSETISSADSDNITWTIVQTEVDYQNLQEALLRSLVTMQSDGSAADLNPIKRAFDIYYSRTSTVQSVYNSVAGSTDTRAGTILARLTLNKKELAVILDSWDKPSLQDISYFMGRVDLLDDDVRNFTTQMLETLVADTSAARVGQLEVFSRFTIFLVAVAGLILGMLAVALLLLSRLQRKSDVMSNVTDTLRRVIETSQDAVVLSDSGGVVLEYNNSARDIFGYEPEEAIGAPMQDLFIPGDQKAAHCDAMARHVATGETSIVDQGRQVMTACDKYGREFTVELMISSSKDLFGETMFIGIIRDISESIKNAKELSHALEKARQDAEVKEKFLAVISHEMRTPLQGVLATYDLLEREIKSENQLALIELGRQSGTKALDQINNTLELVRLNQDSSFSQEEVVDPIASLQNLIDLLAPLLTKRANTVKFEFNAPDDLRIMSNQYLFDSLFDNLLSNANKFTERGDIAVILDAQPVADDRIELQITITDTGVGISSDNLKFIFEDFSTSDNVYTRSFEGTGLGLGIVRRCSYRMGGQLKVESAPGLGSAFSFKCRFMRKKINPVLNPETPTNDKKPIKSSHQADWRKRVLIVDDNEINRIMIGKMLKNLECDHDFAEDGVVAVRKCAATSYDLILMDISMPNLNGMDTAQLISKVCLPQGSIVCITAHNSEELNLSITNAGMTELIAKPIRLQVLADLVNRTPFRAATQNQTLYNRTNFGDIDGIEEPRVLIHEFGLKESVSFADQFDRSLRSELGRVQQQLFAGNQGEAARILHGSAGSASMIGAQRLATLLQFLETLAILEHLDSEEPLLERCLKLLTEFSAEIRRVSEV